MDDQLKSILEQQLRDVHTPDAISWWPLAIGWWVIITLAMVALIWGISRLVRHRRQNRYRRIASNELGRAYTQWQQHQNKSDYLQTANALLKRSCGHFNNELTGKNSNSTALSGAAWLEYLNTYNPLPFSEKAHLALSQELYQQAPDTDIDEVHREVKNWLLKHKNVPNKVSDQTTELHNA